MYWFEYVLLLLLLLLLLLMRPLVISVASEARAPLRVPCESFAKGRTSEDGFAIHAH